MPAHALLVVPPFLKSTTGPLLGPAMLIGAAEAGGHRVQLADLNRAWLLRRPPVRDEPSPFVGDHDRPSEHLRVLQARFAEAARAALGCRSGGALAEDPALTLMVSHEQLCRATGAWMHGAIGAWIREQLDGPRPSLVGVSVMYSGQVLAARIVTEVARRIWPCVPVVWGGAHVTALRDVIRDDDSFEGVADLFVSGYAERTWVALLDAGARGELPRGRVVEARDDATVLPRFDGTGPLWGSRLTLPTQSSRGCAYARCAFCTYPSVEGKYRPLDVAPIEAVVGRAARDGAVVSFKDSLIVPGRLGSLGELIDGRVPWSACTKLHPRLDGAFLTRLASQGLHTLEVGLETLVPAGQRLILKPQTRALLDQTLAGVAASGVALVVNYITGFPGVDAGEEAETLGRLAEQLGGCGATVKLEHNTFQLERTSPMGRDPGTFGLQVTGSWPWSSVLAWR